MTSIKDKNLDDVLNNLFGPAPSAPAQNPNNGGWKEIDLSNMMGGLVPKQINQPLMGPGVPQNIPKVTPKQEAGAPSTVFLREGLKSYRKLEIESPLPVAMEVGPIHNVIGKEFEYCGKVRVYIVENMNKAIDLSKADPNKFMTLVMVRAPFQGTLLVSENAIVKKSDQGQQILRG